MLKALPFALVALALPAQAFDMAQMTEDERTAFRAEIRAYLLENPDVLMEAIGVLETRQAEEAAAGDAELVAQNAEAIFEDGTSWVGGNPEGDVTVVEFLDYRCGYCRRAHPEVSELVESDGDIRLVVKEFPILGEQSLLASRFALAVQDVAGDAAYGRVNDALMAMNEDVTEESLGAIAEAQGLDTEAVMAAMDAPEVAETIARNRALAATLGIEGTPSFVFGEQMVRGYVPLDAMRAIVEDERAG